ncbi:hypothetical protein ETH_00017495 [Eimeria tenella]|uniref:Uncharacterized protein n=1 Tax=Eimeria tenella TaxID=5802 RepID=U6L8V9_EIMTE|nr:hypothetical protein ETH_00017495 [Eimeria tenella]CDJ44969.1 hypothetical protein ETH_00017495 [Eimeria tenella]|eukprot:XP_013235716.1 hypothetical protein ETH_00017495 [Eimeria tenella]
MAEDGTVTEGFNGELPVNHRLLVERFSEVVDEAYKEVWKKYFAVADEMTEVKQQQQPQQLQQQQFSQQQATPVSAVEVASGVESLDLEEGEKVEVAIVSSSDGLNLESLEKYIKVEEVNKMSVEALASGAFAAAPQALALFAASALCVLLLR